MLRRSASLASKPEHLRVRAVAERLAGWAEEKQPVVDKLAGITPTAQEMVAKVVERLRPVIETPCSACGSSRRRSRTKARGGVEVMRREEREEQASTSNRSGEPRAEPSMGR